MKAIPNVEMAKFLDTKNLNTDGLESSKEENDDVELSLIKGISNGI